MNINKSWLILNILDITFSFFSVMLELNNLVYLHYELWGSAYMLDLKGETVLSSFLEARFKYLSCQSGFLTVKMVKVDSNAHEATLSRVWVIFLTPHSVSSPEAISDRGWTRLMGVTDQEGVSAVLSCIVFLWLWGLAGVWSSWCYRVWKDPHLHPIWWKL